MDYEYLDNFKILQKAFNAHRIEKASHLSGNLHDPSTLTRLAYTRRPLNQVIHPVTTKDKS